MIWSAFKKRYIRCKTRSKYWKQIKSFLKETIAIFINTVPGPTGISPLIRSVSSTTLNQDIKNMSGNTDGWSLSSFSPAHRPPENIGQRRQESAKRGFSLFSMVPIAWPLDRKMWDLSLNHLWISPNCCHLFRPLETIHICMSHLSQALLSTFSVRPSQLPNSADISLNIFGGSVMWTTDCCPVFFSDEYQRGIKEVHVLNVC